MSKPSCGCPGICGRFCFLAAGWFRLSRSLALTCWFNQLQGDGDPGCWLNRLCPPPKLVEPGCGVFFSKLVEPGCDEGAARVETISRMPGDLWSVAETSGEELQSVGLTRRGGDRKVVPRLSGRALLRGRTTSPAEPHGRHGRIPRH